MVFIKYYEQESEALKTYSAQLKQINDQNE